MCKDEHFVKFLLFSVLGVLLIGCRSQPVRDAESISQEGAIVPSPTQEGVSLNAEEEPDPNARSAAEEAQLQQLRASFPEAPVLRPVAGSRLAYESGTLWEGGKVVEPIGAGEDMQRICWLHEGYYPPKREILLEISESIYTGNFSEMMDNLGWEGHVTVQVVQGKNHVRFGIAPYHPESVFPTPEEGDQDVLVIYQWNDWHFYVVRGEEHELTQSAQLPSSIDFTSEEVGQVVRELCAQTDNQCRRVHVTIGKYHGAYKMLDFLSLLDRVSPAQEMRLFGMHASERPVGERNLRSLPSSFWSSVELGQLCHAEHH